MVLEAQVTRDQVISQLTKARHRITRTREALIDVMLKLDRRRPFSAADVFKAAGPRHPVDLVTIYRNLEAFEAAGVVCRADRTGDTARFTLAHADHGHHHHHVTCRRCHRVSAISSCALQKTTSAVEELGFSDVEHRLEFTGTCRACAGRRS